MAKLEELFLKKKIWIPWTVGCIFNFTYSMLQEYVSLCAILRLSYSLKVPYHFQSYNVN